MNRTTLALGLALTFTSAALIIGCGGDTTPAPTTTSKPATAAADPNAEAAKLIAGATQYIKDNKWDLADKAVAQLDAKKASMSPDNAKKVDDLKAALAKAEAATKAAPKMP